MSDKKLKHIQNVSYRKVTDQTEFYEPKQCNGTEDTESSPVKSGFSSFSLDLDDYPDSYEMSCMPSDELPAFEIRSISPMGRSPSPISFHDISLNFTKNSIQSENESDDLDDSSQSVSQSSFDYITLREINEQIRPLSDNDESMRSQTSSMELETIFEGVFLETPPRKKGSKSTITMHKKISQNLVKSNQGKENREDFQIENEEISIRCVNNNNRRKLCKDFK